ncbi:MAG: GNAT family N-acetyltransferase [Bacteroidota bacterium]|nr:GNAT family N-acetyltransferase [Bacteroidota bacterium]
MLINQQQSGHKGSFYIGEQDNVLAEMTYTMPSPEKMIIDHTEFSDELRGQHAGSQLLYLAVEYARTHHIKIIPLCPFAAAVFKKKPEYADVLA